MRMRLQPDGVWKLDSRTPNIKSYEQLPQKARDILHLVTVMVPYGLCEEEGATGRRNEADRKVNQVLRGMYPQQSRYTRYSEIWFTLVRNVHEVNINTKLLKQWKAQEEKAK